MTTLRKRLAYLSLETLIYTRHFFVCSKSLELMSETRTLPPLDAFYSSISEKSITADQHRFANKVWKKFKICNLSEYAQLYCRIDTLLLAEIFEKFRLTMIGFSGLDPAHYISLPGFGWDTMLKTTGCKIGLPTDISQIEFVEKSIRGGLSFINTRYARVEDQNKSKILYADAVNLYGKSQTDILPYKNFEWLSSEELREFDYMSVDTNGDRGYILEVDLLYPQKLHFEHNDYPLAPYSGVIEYSDLSCYSKDAYLSSTGKTDYKSSKLLTSFEPKRNYVVHIKNLVLYTQLGMVCTKIHRVLKFRQKAFIKPFIEMCTLARKNASNKFENSLFKKISNSCYGKTIENVRNYTVLKVHYTKNSFQKACSFPTFKHFTILDESVVTTSHYTKEIILNKPFAVGFTILELSKHFMFDFYYNKILPSCGRENVTLLMTDTDSFIMHLKDASCLDKLNPYMDFSNYPTDHPQYNILNRSKLGCFKDEIDPNYSIVEFVGLRSKCYALKIKSNETGQREDKKVCKGLGRVCIENRLRFSQYKDCLFQKKDIRHHFTGISSKKHDLFTSVKNKKALSFFDSKRYILPCGIHSLPYGSHFIETLKNGCDICPKMKYKHSQSQGTSFLFPEELYHLTC